jgi:hypothetical protein
MEVGQGPNWGCSAKEKNHSSRTVALGSTQPRTEMSTRNLPGGNEWSARKADNLTAIYDPIV